MDTIVRLSSMVPILEDPEIYASRLGYPVQACSSPE